MRLMSRAAREMSRGTHGSRNQASGGRRGARQKCRMTALKHPIENRIERTINLGELHRVWMCRRVRQRRVRQQKAREADWAVVIIIGQPRRKLLCRLACCPDVPDAYEVGAIEPRQGEIMLVDMRERQHELQRERRQREIGSASSGEGSLQYHVRPCQGAVPRLKSGGSKLPPSAERAQWPTCIGNHPAINAENMAMEGL